MNGSSSPCPGSGTWRVMLGGVDWAGATVGRWLTMERDRRVSGSPGQLSGISVPQPTHTVDLRRGGGPLSGGAGWQFFAATWRTGGPASAGSRVRFPNAAAHYLTDQFICDLDVFGCRV